MCSIWCVGGAVCVCVYAHICNARGMKATRGGEYFLEAPFRHDYHSGLTHREGKVNEA